MVSARPSVVKLSRPLIQVSFGIACFGIRGGLCCRSNKSAAWGNLDYDIPFPLCSSCCRFVLSQLADRRVDVWKGIIVEGGRLVFSCVG